MPWGRGNETWRAPMLFIYILSGTFLERINLCGDRLSQFLCISFLHGHGSHVGLVNLVWGHSCIAWPRMELSNWKLIAQLQFCPTETHDRQHTNNPFSKSELPGCIRFITPGGHWFGLLVGFVKRSSRLDWYPLRPLKLWCIVYVYSTLIFSGAPLTCSTTHSHLSLFNIAQWWQPGVPQGRVICSLGFRTTHVLR